MRTGLKFSLINFDYSSPQLCCKKPQKNYAKYTVLAWATGQVNASGNGNHTVKLCVVFDLAEHSIFEHRNSVYWLGNTVIGGAKRMT
jgi:hypothetical protein